MSTETTPKKVMSQKKYVRRAGTCCPFCRCDSVSGDGIVIDAGYATQEVGCDTCGREWVDQYRLTGFTYVVPAPAEEAPA